LRNPEKNGKKLPFIRNSIDVTELGHVVKKLLEELQTLKEDFEKFYSELSKGF